MTETSPLLNHVFHPSVKLLGQLLDHKRDQHPQRLLANDGTILPNVTTAANVATILLDTTPRGSDIVMFREWTDRVPVLLYILNEGDLRIFNGDRWLLFELAWVRAALASRPFNALLILYLNHGISTDTTDMTVLGVLRTVLSLTRAADAASHAGRSRLCVPAHHLIAITRYTLRGLLSERVRPASLVSLMNGFYRDSNQCVLLPHLDLKSLRQSFEAFLSFVIDGQARLLTRFFSLTEQIIGTGGGRAAAATDVSQDWVDPWWEQLYCDATLYLFIAALLPRFCGEQKDNWLSQRLIKMLVNHLVRQLQRSMQLYLTSDTLPALLSNTAVGRLLQTLGCSPTCSVVKQLPETLMRMDLPSVEEAHSETWVVLGPVSALLPLLATHHFPTDYTHVYIHWSWLSESLSLLVSRAVNLVLIDITVARSFTQLQERYPLLDKYTEETYQRVFEKLMEPNRGTPLPGGIVLPDIEDFGGGAGVAAPLCMANSMAFMKRSHRLPHLSRVGLIHHLLDTGYSVEHIRERYFPAHVDDAQHKLHQYQNLVSYEDSRRGIEWERKTGCRRMFSEKYEKDSVEFSRGCPFKVSDRAGLIQLLAGEEGGGLDAEADEKTITTIVNTAFAEGRPLVACRMHASAKIKKATGREPPYAKFESPASHVHYVLEHTQRAAGERVQ